LPARGVPGYLESTMTLDVPLSVAQTLAKQAEAPQSLKNAVAEAAKAHLTATDHVQADVDVHWLAKVEDRNKNLRALLEQSGKLGDTFTRAKKAGLAVSDPYGDPSPLPFYAAYGEGWQERSKGVNSSPNRAFIESLPSRSWFNDLSAENKLLLIDALIPKDPSLGPTAAVLANNADGAKHVLRSFLDDARWRLHPERPYGSFVGATEVKASITPTHIDLMLNDKHLRLGIIDILESGTADANGQTKNPPRTEIHAGYLSDNDQFLGKNAPLSIRSHRHLSPEERSDLRTLLESELAKPGSSDDAKKVFQAFIKGIEDDKGTDSKDLIPGSFE
jgi:hypothetical protein